MLVPPQRHKKDAKELASSEKGQLSTLENTNFGSLQSLQGVANPVAHLGFSIAVSTGPVPLGEKKIKHSETYITFDG